MNEPDFGLPGKLGFWQNRHIDDIALRKKIQLGHESKYEGETYTQSSVHLTLCSSRELRAFHANDSLLAVHPDRSLRVLVQNLLDQRFDEL